MPWLLAEYEGQGLRVVGRIKLIAYFISTIKTENPKLSEKSNGNG